MQVARHEELFQVYRDAVFILLIGSSLIIMMFHTCIFSSRRSYSALPIIEFYKYLWSSNRGLLYFSLFVNYAFPIILESLPWYFSRRLLASRLRDLRNSINHNLFAGHPVQSSELWIYVLMTLTYAAIHTLDQILKDRVQLSQKLIIKRLVVERILFSEVGSLERKFQQLFGTGAVRPDQLEVRVFRDISDTLHLFNFTLPTLVRGIWTVALQGRELYYQRAVIDALAIARPAIVTAIQEGLDYALDQVVDVRRTENLDKNSMDMSQLVSTVVEGLVEIQINNMQQHQLNLLDRMTSQEMNISQGVTTFGERVYKTVSNRSVLDFVSEVMIVQRVMQRTGIDHERYRKIQNDIDYVFKLVRRNTSLIRQFLRVFQTQSRVVELISLPSFASESDGCVVEVGSSSINDQFECNASALLQNLAPSVYLTSFHELRVRSIKFSYEPELAPALDINPSNSAAPFQLDTYAQVDSCPSDDQMHHIEWSSSILEPSSLPTDLVIRPGKIYGIVGQNRSGKSTLVQILCKLFHPDPTQTEIVFNGHLPLHSVARKSIRELISYVAQRPFIFPGTIAENIRMSRPDATDWEVECAAEDAGCFIFESPFCSPADQLMENEVSIRSPSSSNFPSGHLQALPSAPQNSSSTSHSSIHESASPHQSPHVLSTSDNTFTSTTMPRPLKPWELQKKWWLQLGPLSSVIDSLKVSASTFWKSAISAFSQDQTIPETLNTIPNISKNCAPSTSSYVIEPVSEPYSSSDSIEDTEIPNYQDLSDLFEEIDRTSETMHPTLCIPTCARGSNLSGGFAQSVALARIFLKPKSKIVILDESMGQMDSVKKREFIMPRLYEFVRKNNMALLFISHEIATMRDMDHIFVLENGRLSCQGSHEQLLAEQAPAYLKLVGSTG